MSLTDEISLSGWQSQSTALKAQSKLIGIKCGMLCHLNPDRMSDVNEEPSRLPLQVAGMQVSGE